MELLTLFLGCLSFDRGTDRGGGSQTPSHTNMDTRREEWVDKVCPFVRLPLAGRVEEELTCSVSNDPIMISRDLFCIVRIIRRRVR